MYITIIIQMWLFVRTLVMQFYENVTIQHSIPQSLKTVLLLSFNWFGFHSWEEISTLGGIFQQKLILFVATHNHSLSSKCLQMFAYRHDQFGTFLCGPHIAKCLPLIFQNPEVGSENMMSQCMPHNIPQGPRLSICLQIDFRIP